MPGLIVIGYDGSADAVRAIDDAARVLDADAALVAHVWLQAPAAGESMLPLAATVPPLPDQDQRLGAAARNIAQDGAARTRRAGLNAEPVTLRATSTGDVGPMLATLADERGATAIVVGRRGVSRLEAAVLGSTSSATVREARCPVLVAPPPED
jgi:nucleotide-binding universal stress UspA family protein